MSFQPGQKISAAECEDLQASPIGQAKSSCGQDGRPTQQEEGRQEGGGYPGNVSSTHGAAPCSGNGRETNTAKALNDMGLSQGDKGSNASIAGAAGVGGGDTRFSIGSSGAPAQPQPMSTPRPATSAASGAKSAGGVIQPGVYKLKQGLGFGALGGAGGEEEGALASTPEQQRGKRQQQGTGPSSPAYGPVRRLHTIATTTVITSGATAAPSTAGGPKQQQERQGGVAGARQVRNGKGMQQKQQHQQQQPHQQQQHQSHQRVNTQHQHQQQQHQPQQHQSVQHSQHTSSHAAARCTASCCQPQQGSSPAATTNSQSANAAAIDNSTAYRHNDYQNSSSYNPMQAVPAQQGNSYNRGTSQTHTDGYDTQSNSNQKNGNRQLPAPLPQQQQLSSFPATQSAHTPSQNFPRSYSMGATVTPVNTSSNSRHSSSHIGRNGSLSGTRMMPGTIRVSPVPPAASSRKCTESTPEYHQPQQQQQNHSNGSQWKQQSEQQVRQGVAYQPAGTSFSGNEPQQAMQYPQQEARMSNPCSASSNVAVNTSNYSSSSVIGSPTLTPMTSTMAAMTDCHEGLAAQKPTMKSTKMSLLRLPTLHQVRVASPISVSE